MRLNTFLAAQGPVIRRGSLRPSDQRSLESAVAAGLVVRLLPGVYTPAVMAEDISVRLLAVAAWQPDAVVTGRAAAMLTFWPTIRVPHIVLARRGHPPRSRGYRFEQRTIDPDHVVQVGSVRVASAALTAIDLVDDLGGDAIDTCLRARAARLEDLWSAFAAHPSRPGNADRRRMLLDSRDEPWSAAERLAHRLVRAAHLTGWTANYRVRIRGRRYFIDIAFPALRLAVEIDGRLHEEDPSIFENDRYRQNGLVSAGWTVLRFTYAMLLADPDYVIETITQEVALLRRAPLRRAPGSRR